MRVGFVGLGKLGLPVALTIASRGHELFGYDTNPAIAEYLRTKSVPYREEGLRELLQQHSVTLTDVETLKTCDLVFVAVQTPHDPRYEGISPLPATRRDFDYSYLESALDGLSGAACPVVVISTVLPGTMARLRPNVRLVYSPQFIAMGTTVHDYLHPEFTLLGTHDEDAAKLVTEFFGTIHSAPVARMSIESAELTKVAYNTFIGLKVVFANTLMEICEHTGADVDEVTNALGRATDRLISPKYMRAGMGDGGGCHPRDNIALSWLAKKLGISYDLFEKVMECRDAQTEWLARKAWDASVETGLPVVILGKAYKAGSNLTVGSPALLLAYYLREHGVEFSQVDPRCGDLFTLRPAVYVIATDHPEFSEYSYPAGSVVIDPWREIGRASASSPRPSLSEQAS